MIVSTTYDIPIYIYQPTNYDRIIGVGPAPAAHRQISSLHVLRAVDRPDPLQHRKVPFPGGRHRAGKLAPVAAVLPRPLQHREVSTTRCGLARAPLWIHICSIWNVPWAAVRPQPLQHRKVTAARRRARALTPGAAVVPRPLEHRQGAVPRDRLADSVDLQ